MGQEVLDNKNAVDKTAQDFNLTAQQALADVNNAGQTQTERVQSAGTTAVENIENAQNTATQAVETAKNEAIKAVQTEGTTHTGTVTAEGEKQVQAVQTAAQEIIADREQITKNKTDIADLRQGKANAIVETASGTLLNVKDSADALFEDFSVYGKSEQAQTTGKNILSIPNIDINTPETIIKCNISKDICISVQEKATVSKSVWRFMALYKNNDKQYITDASLPGVFYATSENPIVSITCRGIMITSGVYRGIMVEYGEAATSYEPYTGGKPSPSPEYPQEIVNAGRLNEDTGKYEVNVKVTGKNLLNISSDEMLREASLIDKKTNTVQCNIVNKYYSCVRIKNEEFLKNIMDSTGKKINFKCDTSKTMDTCVSITIFGNRTNGGEYQEAGSALGTNKCSMIISKDFESINNIEFRFNRNIKNTFTDTETIYSNLMCWIGEENIEFETYKEPQTLTLTSDRPLTKWDRLEKREGIWGIARQGEILTIDGSTENLTKYHEQESRPEGVSSYFVTTVPITPNETDIISTHFKRIDGAWSSGKNGEFSSHPEITNIYFCTTIPTLEDLRVWLDTEKSKGHPVTFAFPKNVETWEPLPEETQKILKALYTNYPTTIISNSEDTEMQLTYVADTKNYTDRKIEEAVTAQMQNLANLLSLMPLATQAALIENDTNRILESEVNQ